MVKETGNKCSEEDINLVATLFVHHSNGIPGIGGYQGFHGFYCLYLISTKYEADPKVFFKILEVDQKIGWADRALIENFVFYYKGINIIDDQQVSGPSQ